jgi:hypothetical protein
MVFNAGRNHVGVACSVSDYVVVYTISTTTIKREALMMHSAQRKIPSHLYYSPQVLKNNFFL